MPKYNKDAKVPLILSCYVCALGAFGAFFRWLQMQVARDSETGPINPSILNFLLPAVIIAAAVVVLLHVWRRNTLLSIVAGTAVYMLLVQLVFV